MTVSAVTVQVSVATLVAVVTRPVFRGSTITFSASFVNAAGEAVEPDQAVLTISYKDLTGTRVRDSVYLAQDDSIWVYDWDSFVASHGMVRWSINATFDDKHVADDGEFGLYANAANISPLPTPPATVLTTEDGDTITTEDGDAISA